ncbi:MAG: NADP-dependent malic enzyme [Candidatus Rokubacteria bacterium]|nr:NADP-dependent malic enzyme [Candidatus Rokubacteria bacterium]
MRGAVPASREALLARAQQPSAEALRLHPFYRGKLQTALKCPIRGFGDFAIWYTPGVAAPCRAIQADPALAYAHTNKANTIAIVTDGTRVLGLGDIGPEAALPVMEGKALLYKYLGGVDAIPLCLATKDPDEIVRTVEVLAPAFGGINLEDIAQPKCFRILDALRARLSIPVWHDDQQGTATALLAGLLNALALVGKDLRHARLAMVGMGAANVASYRLLTASGARPEAIVACDSRGTLHRGRGDIEARRGEFADKWRVCTESNVDGITGGIAEALRGADACIAFSTSGPDIVRPEWVRAMAPDAIVFACANPVPEIWPWDALEAGARIVATGRSDFPNQLNNSLVFPGLFRGALDVRARTITDGMAGAVARAVAAFAQARGIREDDILPRMDEWDLHVRVAAAAAAQAQAEGVARLDVPRAALEAQAAATMRTARETTHVLMREGLIPPPPA